jgi:bacteriocin-like protein
MKSLDLAAYEVEIELTENELIEIEGGRCCNIVIAEEEVPL